MKEGTSTAGGGFLSKETSRTPCVVSNNNDNNNIDNNNNDNNNNDNNNNDNNNNDNTFICRCLSRPTRSPYRTPAQYVHEDNRLRGVRIKHK